MKPKLMYAALSATLTMLRADATFSLASDIQVDEKAGIIRNCAVMTVGPWRGRDCESDRTSLEQLKAIIDANPDGMSMRFTHPTMKVDNTDQTITFSETLGTDVGRLKNVRIVGESLRGDVYLGEYAKVLPGLGNVWDYLICKAKNDPAGIGLSAVIGFDVEPVGLDASQPEKLVARIEACIAVDFVGTPAANPNGLLSATNNKPGAARLLAALASAECTGDVMKRVKALAGLCNLGITIKFPKPKNPASALSR